MLKVQLKSPKTASYFGWFTLTLCHWITPKKKNTIADFSEINGNHWLAGRWRKSMKGQQWCNVSSRWFTINLQGLIKCILFTLLSWSLDMRGISQMMKIPSSSNPAPPLLRLGVLLRWSIGSPYFHSRNPSAAYHNIAPFPKDTAYFCSHN